MRALIALLACGIALPALPQGSMTLLWTPPTTNTDGSPLTNLAGYRVYYGTAPGSYSYSLTLNNAGLSSYVLGGLTPATWYAVLTALTSAGTESLFSNSVSKTIAGQPTPTPPPPLPVVSSTRIEAADWTCRDSTGAIVSSHQRQDTAFAACANLAWRNPGKVYELRPSGYRIVAQ